MIDPRIVHGQSQFLRVTELTDPQANGGAVELKRPRGGAPARLFVHFGRDWSPPRSITIDTADVEVLSTRYWAFRSIYHFSGCSTDKAMEENSTQALEEEPVEVFEIRFDLLQLLPVERIKAGLTEIALGLAMFAALVAFCCSR
jgi:hypothetical protein